MRRLEQVTNVAIIIAVSVFLALTINHTFFQHSVKSKTSMVGRTVELSGLPSSKKQATLILAISSSCHFCRASEPFYQEIIAKTKGRTNIVAVLPQPKDEAVAYLKNAGLVPTQIISTSLDAIGVAATPTILLIDPDGKVRKEWVGKLDKSREVTVLASVGAI